MSAEPAVEALLTEPTVSVVVPTARAPLSLYPTLASIIGQDGVLEVIVVDDTGAPSLGMRVLTNLDERVRVISHDTNKGVSATRNTGIAAARGDWIAFCDDDDLWTPGKLRAQLEAVARTGARWCVTAALVIDDGNQPRALERTDPPAFTADALRVANAVPGGCSSVMVERSLLDKVGGFDESLSIFADWDLWIRLAEVDAPALVDVPLVHYREHGNQMSLDHLTAGHELARVAERNGIAADEQHFMAMWVMRRARRLGLRQLAGAVAQLGGRLRPFDRLRLAAVALQPRPLRARRDQRRTARELARLPATTAPDRPLVSIIITSYNYARYVVDAIDSALEQTYPHVEVIVVDDGSTDGSPEIIRRYGDRIIGVIDDHRGFCAAVNRGFAVSSGEIICLLDADDRYHRGRVAEVVAAFERDPTIVQLSHARRCVDASGRPLFSRRRRLSRGQVVNQLWRWGRYECATTSGLAYPRWAFELLSPIEPRYGVDTVDTYLTAAAPLLGPVGSSDRPMFDYRLHGANMQAGRMDVDFLTAQRRATLDEIADRAATLGYHGRGPAPGSHLDSELVCLAVAGGQVVSLRRRLRVLGRSLRECIDLRRSVSDTVLTVGLRAAMLFTPKIGRELASIGPGEFVRVRLLRRPATRPFGEAGR